MRLQMFFSLLLIAHVCSAQDDLLNQINTLTEEVETLKTEVETIKTFLGMYTKNSFNYYHLITI